MKNQTKIVRVFSGECLRRARINKNMTLKGVADRVGVKWQAILRYEIYQTVPSANVLMLLADAVGVNIYDLFEDVIK